MNWLTNLFAGGAGKLIETVGGVVDEFHLSGEEKARLKMELETLLQKRDSELEQTLRQEMESKERVMVAELNQGDNYTKRARPTVVYFGLFVIFFNHCLIPLYLYWTSDVGISAKAMEPFNLPVEFWVAWGGVVGAYSLGRSAEKFGINNALTRAATGSKPPRTSLFENAKG